MTPLYPLDDPVPPFPFFPFSSGNSSSTGSSSSLYSSTPSSSTFTSSEIPSPGIPTVPSTFLPSYYPESRHGDVLPSHSESNHGANKKHRTALSDPSPRHLLDGIAIHPPRPPRSSMRPTYELSPGIASRSLPPVPRPWMPPTPRDPLNRMFHDTGGSSYGRSFARPTSLSSSPHLAGRHLSAQAMSRPNPSPPRMPSIHPASAPSSAPLPDCVPPPSASRDLSVSSAHSHSHSPTENTSLEPVSQSAAYPKMLFTDVAPPAEGPGSDAGGTEGKVDGTNYARALSIYEHILESIPHFQSEALTGDAPNPDSVAFDSILNLAFDGSQIISGDTPSTTSRDPDKSKSASPRVAGKRSAPGEKIKPATKCMGCGTTETPEWRRGPMGPRSLCNACGLVHMKLQRKRRKIEEKAAAAAVAASATGSGKGPPAAKG